MAASVVNRTVYGVIHDVVGMVGGVWVSAAKAQAVCDTLPSGSTVVAIPVNDA